MNRIYFHYKEWEDFKYGMYNFKQVNNEKDLIEKSANLLKDNDCFYIIMQKVISEWKKATEMNLTNKSRNRQAWLGQAACCYAFRTPEYITKLAWRTLTEEEKKEANKTADKIINCWEKIYKNGKPKSNIYNFEEYKKMKEDKEKREGKQITLAFQDIKLKGRDF